MKKILSLFFVLLLSCVVEAQVDHEALRKQQQSMKELYTQERNKMRQQYDDAKKQALADYAAFRKKANEEYAAALRQAWEQMGVSPAVPKPKEPEPPKPPAPAPDQTPTTEPLPQAKVTPVSVPKQVVLPAPPIPEASPQTPSMQIPFYGTSFMAYADATQMRFKLTSLDESAISKAWGELSQEKYDGILHDCLAQRDSLHLGDWGYICLLQSATESLLGTGTNEAVLLQMYLLTQSGYNVRLARSDGHLVLLIPFSHGIYNYSYTTIDGMKYYMLTKSESRKLSVCKVGFPREQVANIQMSELPRLCDNPVKKRPFAAERFGTMRAEVGVSKSLIEFMNDYPLSGAWDCYALAGLSDVAKSDLYPMLRSQIEGKSTKKAVTMLLDFVQTAFEYATDDEQFGYERPLFADESFYYPKNDCEDRSILFSILVRDLLGLDVVLVHWPGHLATAVAFPNEVEGDYFMVGNRRFTVCDPTYIGAGVGMTMPRFKNVDANLVTL